VVNAELSGFVSFHAFSFDRLQLSFCFRRHRGASSRLSEGVGHNAQAASQAPQLSRGIARKIKAF